MKWNKWPYWVRGGAIGFLAYACLAFTLSAFIAADGCGVQDIPSEGSSIDNTNCPTYLSMFVFNIKAFFIETFRTPLLLFVTLFVCILAGFIYGKIKNRKSNQGQTFPN